MAVNDWIDSVATLMAVSDGAGGTVRSYRVYEKAEFPESITVYPCALSYVSGVQFVGGHFSYAVWSGVTEFHLMPNANKANLPRLMLYIARIYAACNASIQLGGLVEHFLLKPGGPNIVGPVQLKYGSEEPHHGLVVNWEVKENVSDEVTVAA